MVLVLLLLVTLMGSYRLARHGYVLPRHVSDERCEQLHHDPDGYDELTGKKSAELYFGLSCDDRGSVD
jgi:hypothetical protein